MSSIMFVGCKLPCLSIKTISLTNASCVPAGNSGKFGLGATRPGLSGSGSHGLGKSESVFKYLSVASRPSGRRMKIRKTDLPEKKSTCDNAMGEPPRALSMAQGPFESKRFGGKKDCSRLFES